MLVEIGWCGFWYQSPDKDCDVDREMSGWSWRNGLLSRFMTIIVETDVSDEKK